MIFSIDEAVAAHRSGELIEAERAYRAIIQIQPSHPAANHNLGIIATTTHNLNEALKLFKVALENAPHEEQFWLSYINCLIQKRNFKLAKKAVKKAEKKGVNKKKLRHIHALLASPAKEVNRVQKKPSKEEIDKVFQQYKNGNFNNAITLSRALTKRFPSCLVIWKVLAASLFQNGSKVEALNVNKKALELAPQDAEIHNNLGTTLIELDRFDEAETSFRKAIKFKHDFPEANNGLGIALRKLQRHDEAQISFKKAIALKANYPEAYNNLGNSLTSMRKFNEAEKSYKEAIKFKPDYSEAFNNLGIALWSLGRLAESEASFRHAIRMKPDYAEAFYNLGNLLRHLGKLSVAEEAYRIAIDLKPNHAEAFLNLGNLLQEASKLDEAEINFRHAITLKSDYAEAYCNLGHIFRKQNKTNEAIASYRQAIKYKPNFGEPKHLLDSLLGKTTSAAPLDYVEKLFDGYAIKFEKSLIDQLDYNLPTKIAKLTTKDKEAVSLGSVLDLGCGTGLVGVEVQQHSEYLEGVDLSEKMLQQANKKDCYNKLVRKDIISYLSKSELDFDYFIAADVFSYLGELSKIFCSIKNRNKRCGKLIFSTENSERSGFFLERTGRYSHSRNYIEGLCEEFEFEMQHSTNMPLRKHEDGYITGTLYFLSFSPTK
tara:strand:+ start:3815 stop:5785 length:1971 start_codon:yes stop_codon:yes gene_type:complete